MYTGTMWKETEPERRKLNPEELTAGIQGTLALRGQIEAVIDRIWENDFDGIYFMGIGGTYASAMQAEVYMRGKSELPVYAANAAEFNTTGIRRFTSQSAVIFSSVSGTTSEMVEMVHRVHEIGGHVFGFVDTPGSPLAENCDDVICYPKNEQLKFLLICNYLMYKNREFSAYHDWCANMEEALAGALLRVEEESDAWAREYAVQAARYHEAHPDMPFTFVASGNLYGGAYSLGMCYWEEQMWIRTRVISAGEFFHGFLEVVEKDTPVTVFIGEDEQRALGERVARFLPQVSGRYTIVDTREFALEGIREEYRGMISHLVIRAVNNRIDAYMEHELRHPLSIRRYYRQLEG